MMRPCSETPTAKGPQDEGCLQTLTSMFSFLYRIGNKKTVSASLVFRLSQKSQEIVVKAIPLKKEEDLKDIKIACLLNGLTEESPIFVRTFGWIKCKEIPPLWTKGLNLKKDAPESFSKGKIDNYIFQVMSFSSHPWTDMQISLDLEEYRVMLFLLLHGLLLAKNRFGFKHNDIHEGQVLFQMCTPNTPIVVEVGKQRYTIVCQRFVPKLIDFGLSTIFGEKEEDEDNSYSISNSEEEDDFERVNNGVFDDQDIRDLLYMFEQRMEKDKVVPFVFQKGRTATLESILLKDPVFESLRKNVATINSHYFCDVCSSVAHMEWQNKGIRFCDDTCAYQWVEISKMLV